MQVIINGEQTELASGTSVRELVEQLGIQGKVAIEVNREIVPRSRFDSHDLKEGDRIEIVRAIGGG